jgi:serine phosphatase RsbU (regulator of sigma subunit)/anti-sigma regulatory factor (Ser/Thr protein kinase)
MLPQEIQEKLFNYFVTPACIINSNLSLVEYNDEFVALSGIKKEKIEKRISLTLVLDIDVFQRKPTPIDTIKNNNERYSNAVIRAINNKGKHLSLKMSVLPLQIIVGSESDLYILLFADATEETTAAGQFTSLCEHEKNEYLRIQETLTYELDIAKKVQSGMLPHILPSLISFDISSTYMPVEKVGGDLYDLIQIKDNRIAVFIFDVSGHGVPSALIGAMTKTLFTYHLKSGCKPSEVFTLVNKELCAYIKSGHYLTAFLGIIDSADNTMIYAQAGHVYPLIYHANGGAISSIIANSLFIGHVALADIAEYHDSVIKFDWNDKLLLYTDGITDSINDTDEMYGQERLKNALMKYCCEKSDVFIRMLTKDNEQFRNGCPLLDDFSLICIQFGCSRDILNESGFKQEDRPEVMACHSHDEIEDVCSKVMSRLDKNGYTHTEIFQAHIAVHEIIANAIEHGNNYNPDKRAIVFFKVLLDLFCVSVVDEGNGFNHSILKRELTPEDMLRPRGKGLYAVGKLMNEITFNEKGNRVMIKKSRNMETI